MTGEGSVLTSMTHGDALAAAEIHALRQISDAISAQTRRLDSIDDKVDDVRERVARMEGADSRRAIGENKAAIKELSDRIKSLEDDRNQVRGVASFWGWLIKAAPWLFAGIAAFLAGIGLKQSV